MISKKGLLVTVSGDFNIELAKMETRNSVNFSNLLRSLNLICSFTNPTHSSSCIDNILVNSSAVNYTVGTLDEQFADHLSSIITIFPIKSTVEPCKNKERVTSNKTTFRNQSEREINKFIECLKEENWEMIDEFILGKLSIDELFHRFFSKYVNLWHFCSPLISKHLPSQGSFSRTRDKFRWYDSKLAKEREIMLNFFNIYKNLKQNNSDQTPLAYNAYLAARRTYRSHLTRSKRQAYEQYIDTASNRCKAAWEVINMENSCQVRSEVSLDPELVNNYFLNSVKDITNSLPATKSSIEDLLGKSPTSPNSFQWKVIEPSEVVRVVNKLSNSGSMDYFSLSNKIIKRTVEYIQQPLAFIFSKCLEFGYFADALKVSKVIPIYKKGDKHMPKNYRPVSIVPILSKVFEALMHNQLSSYFENNNLMSESQYGYRVGRSTTDAVMEIVDHTLKAFDSKESVALSLLDLSKAFDCVPFTSIIQKLKFYGISEVACKVIASYLENRLQYVCVKGSNSSMQKVTIGVPQGSILGPFFFSIVINDLPNNLSVNSVIYADDTSLFASNKNVCNLQAIIETSQEEASNWFCSNGLNCNQEKTQNIILSLSTEQVQTVKLLGFWLDTKLNWSDHIDKLCNRISRVSFLLWKLRDIVSFDYLKTCYFGLFQSHIAYGLILWGHSSAVHRVLLIQKNVLRTICRAAPLEHCKPLFIHTKILTITNLYIYHILIFAKSNLHLFTNRHEIHEHFTRNRGNLDIPRHRLAKVGTSHLVNAIHFFNKLHNSAKLCSLKTFKHRMLNWLQNNPCYTIQEFSNCDIEVEFY